MFLCCDSEAETEKLVSKLKAETENKVAEITNKKSLAEKEAFKTMQEIENKILTVREEAKAEAIKCNNWLIQTERRKIF